MALSDIVRKIEDSSRSTKVAVVAVGVAAAAVAAAIFVVISQPDHGPEPASLAAAVVVVTATPTAQVFSAPSPTPQPTPTSTPPPTSTPEPQPEEPTPLPTETPLPTATPTPDIDDYYVVLASGKELRDGGGSIEFYASYEGVASKGLTLFYKDDDFLSYLVREGVITSNQKDAYFKGERIPASLLDISNAVYKMIQNEGIFKFREYFSLHSDSAEYVLTHYADKSSSGSNGGVLGGKISLEGSEGYVTISDGKISVSAVDDDGVTTTVNVEGVGAKELLDYWLSQNKITIEQKNQYGQTGKIQFSLKDGVDLLDFGVSSDGGGSVEMDKEVQDKIINDILQLFSSD